MSMWIVAVVLGIVEGLTEFLPVSSTGHLIVTSEILGFHGKRAEVFEIVIQLGAILAVVWEFRAKILRVARGAPTEPGARRFVLRLVIAFLPSAIVGLAVHDFITEHLWSVRTVAAALIVGAVMILAVEAIPRRPRTTSVDRAGWGQAVAIGFAQCLALWPGFSRSAATILGGLGVGLDRRTATEFSFFLAIPTMFAATAYDLWKNHAYLSASDFAWLGLSFAISFVVAWGSVRWLLRYVSTHSFRAFAVYRLIVGVAIFALADRLHVA